MKKLLYSFGLALLSMLLIAAVLSLIVLVAGLLVKYPVAILGVVVGGFFCGMWYEAYKDLP